MRELGGRLKCQVLYFSSRRKLERGIYLDGEDIVYRNPDEVTVCRTSQLQILGTHNYENVMAAVCMAAAYGVPMDIIRDTVKAFRGVEHRIEYVAEKSGVAYYNDSKGTNPDAAIKGIRAMERPTVLIGGGYDKDAVYTGWIESFDGKVKKLVLVGERKDRGGRQEVRLYRLCLCRYVRGGRPDGGKVCSPRRCGAFVACMRQLGHVP